MDVFCIKCGNKLSEDARFCQYCGISRSETYSFMESFANDKSESIAIPDDLKTRDNDLSALKKCLAYFNLFREEYDKKTRFHNELHYLKNKSGCFFALLPIALIILFLYGFKHIFYRIIGFAETLTFSFSGAVVVVFAVLIIISSISSHTRNKRITELTNQINDIYDSLKRHYEKYNNCPISFCYSDPVYLEYFIELIMIKRADSIKEAINIFVDDSYRQKVIGLQQQIEMNTESAARAAWKAANSAADTASAVRWGNTFNMWR